MHIALCTFLAIKQHPSNRKEWLKGRVTLTMTDGLEQHHGIAAIWDKFEKCFGILNNVLHYEPIWRAFLRRLWSRVLRMG